MSDPRTPELAADCTRCFGLCCVLLPFSAVSGFGADKPGGTSCTHLRGDDLCGIHDRLRDEGWPGCTVFDCFGAGQQVSQVTYRGVSWREGANRGEMAAVFTVMRLLHEALFHLDDALGRGPDRALERRRVELVALTGSTSERLLALDLDELLEAVGAELGSASARIRSQETASPQGLAGRDLAGQDLRGRRLRGADLRGSVLIAADLRRVDLTDADLLGVDLRDTDVRGANLAGSLFLSQAQLNAARGDAGTSIPPRCSRPPYWSPGPS